MSDGDPVEFTCSETDRRWVLHKPNGFNKNVRLAQLAPSAFD